MDYAALVISVLALIFTVLSFWWMNWRTGKLRVGKPRSYAAHSSPHAILVEFPFVFFNDGPTPIFVQNLRLVFPDEAIPQPLTFVATVKKLASNDERAMATQFPIDGRQALLLICQFHRQPSDMIIEAKSYNMELQAKLNDSINWKPVCRFQLNVSERSVPIINKQFVAHDNMAE